jgi:ribulose-phosphate 3-epimerase
MRLSPTLPHTIISPSILAADFRRLEEQVKMVEIAGADWIHLDVMDGHFVPNISYGPMVVGVVKKVTDLYLDTHLMISNPDQYLEIFKKNGADLLTVHAEVPGVIPGTLRRIKELGLEAGISINPETPVEKLEGAYELADIILIMSVHPGFGGQSFIPEVLDKLSVISDKINQSGRNIIIEIDGGIGTENAGLVRRAGCRALVAGSSIFHATHPVRALQDIRHAADEAK